MRKIKKIIIGIISLLTFFGLIFTGAIISKNSVEVEASVETRTVYYNNVDKLLHFDSMTGDEAITVHGLEADPDDANTIYLQGFNYSTTAAVGLVVPNGTNIVIKNDASGNSISAAKYGISFNEATPTSGYTFSISSYEANDGCTLNIQVTSTTSSSLDKNAGLYNNAVDGEIIINGAYLNIFGGLYAVASRIVSIKGVPVLNFSSSDKVINATNALNTSSIVAKGSTDTYTIDYIKDNYESLTEVTLDNISTMKSMHLTREPHTHDGIDFTEALTSLGGTLTTGNYFLSEDTTLTKNVVIPAGAIVNIDTKGSLVELGDYYFDVQGTLGIYACTDNESELKVKTNSSTGLLEKVTRKQEDTIAGSSFYAGTNSVFKVSGNGKLNINDIKLVGNQSATNGGVISATYSTYSSENAIALNDVYIAGNVCAASGGAIYAEKANITLNNTTIENNYAYGSSTSIGGAIALNDSILYFNNNSADNNINTNKAGTNYASSTANNVYINGNSHIYFYGAYAGTIGVNVGSSNYNTIFASRISGTMSNCLQKDNSSDNMIITSEGAKMSIPDVTITQQPAKANNYTIVATPDQGCTITGYQWYNENDEVIEGQTTSTITSVSEIGNYYCIVFFTYNSKTYNKKSDLVEIDEIISNHAISFSANGGTGEAASLSGLSGSNVTIPATVNFAYTGYTLDGFNTMADGTGTNYNLGSTIAIGSSDFTLYCHWIINDSSLTFDKRLVEDSTLSSGNYYVYDSYSLTQNLIVPATETVNIFLNGKSISTNQYTIQVNGTLNIYDSSNVGSIKDANTNNSAITVSSGAYLYVYSGNISNNSGHAITNNGTTTICGGNISYNSSSAIVNNHALTLNAGNITNNTSSCGSAIYNNTSATFIMMGGNIKDNSSTQYDAAITILGPTSLLGGTISSNTITSTQSDFGGGAFRIDNSSLLTLGGSIQITNNKANDVANNILLVNDLAKFSISSTTLFTEDASIYVSHKLASSSMGIKDICNANATNYSSYIHSDNSNYLISYRNNAIILQNPFTITYYPNGATGNIVDSTLYKYNDEATIKNNSYTYSGYVFKGYATSSTSKTIVFSPSDTVNMTSSLNLYAIWKKAIVTNSEVQSKTYTNTDYAYTISSSTDNLNDFTVTYKLHSESTYSSTLPHNAGSYDVKIVRNEDDTYNGYELVIQNGLVINKAVYDFTNVRWNYYTPFVYDGTEKEVTIYGLPSGVSVNHYERNKYTNQGSYSAKVYFNYDSVNYYTPTYKECGWEIRRADIEINLDVQKYLYDSSNHEFNITGKNSSLEGFSVSYKLNGSSDGYSTSIPSKAGNYDVKITRTTIDNYNQYTREITNGLTIGFEVQFELVNTTTGTTPDTIDIYYGSLELPNPATYSITRTEFNFAGWNDGNKTYQTTINITANTTLKTYWNPIILNEPSVSNNYQIEVQNDTGISYQWYRLVDEEEVIITGQTTSTLTNFSYSGYYFCKLTYDTDCYYNSSTIFVPLISFDLNGGSGDLPASVALKTNSSYTIPSVTLTKDGYVFVGFNTKEDGTGTTYFAGNSLTVLEENIVLYALYVIEYNDIEFNKIFGLDSILETGNYYLKNNVELTNNITIEEGSTVNIYLNGYSLNANNYSIINNGTLAIYDNSTTTYKFSKNSDDLFVLDESGSYTLTGAIIYNASTKAIENNNVLVIAGVNFVGNSGKSIYSTGTTTIENATFKGNNDVSIYVDSNTTTINNATLSNNNATAIYVNGSLVVNNATITNNKATIAAGIYYEGSSLVINNVTISNNEASKYAGMYINATNAKLLGANISNNIVTSTTGTRYQDYGVAGVAYNYNLEIGGNITINNNKTNGKQDNLVCINNEQALLTITSLNNSSIIGYNHILASLTMEKLAIATTNEVDYSSNLVCDDSNYIVRNIENTLKFQFIYKFSYDANGGVATLPDEVYYYDATTITIPELVFTKVGYSFAGLCKDSNGKSTIYQIGEEVEINEAHTVLYAIYRHTHEDDEMHFDKMLNASSGTIVSGNYFLDNDVTLTSNIIIPVGVVVNLCLDGKILNLGTYKIENQGTLNIYDCQENIHTFKENANHIYVLDETGSNEIAGGIIYASSNIAIQNLSTGILTINGGNIVGSTRYAILNANELTINGGSIKGNGLSITSSKTFVLNGGYISSNNGAGVEISSGSFTMNGGYITNNTNTAGSAIRISKGSFTLNNGEITNNIGTAIYATSSSDSISLNLLGGKIKNNLVGDASIGAAGVIYSENTTLTLGGNVYIYDNYVDGNQANILTGLEANAYYSIEAKYFTFNVSTTTPLLEGAHIGIANKNCDGENNLFAISEQLDANYIQYFTADDDVYAIGDYEESSKHILKMQLPFKVTYVASGTFDGSLPVDNNNYGNNQTVKILNCKAKRLEEDKGYAIYKWTTIEGSMVPMYERGQTFIITGNVTLYGIWEEALGEDPVQINTDPQSYTYNGSRIDYQITGEPNDDFEITYKDQAGNIVNAPIDTGVYDVILFRQQDYIYAEYNYTIEDGLTINKANATIDTSKVVKELVYDGVEKTINKNAELNHSETKLVYTNNKFTNAGSYEVTISAIETTNYNAISTTITVVVLKATATISTASVVKEYTYDGNEIVINNATLNHSETTLVYTNNKFTNAGKYTVSINAIETANYNATNTSFEVVVKKAQIDMSDVEWDYENPFTYDGNSKTVSIKEETLPDLVEIEGYTGNVQTNASSYKASAIYSLTNENYELINVSDLDWKINKANYDISGISFENKTITYDGNNHSIAITGTLPTGIDNIQLTVSYQGSSTNVTSGTKVKAIFASTSTNYNIPSSLEATLVINPKVIEINWVTKTYTYTGKVQAIRAYYVDVQLDEVDLLVTCNKDFKNAGSYQATASFANGETNYVLPSNVLKSYTINKAVIDMSKAKWNYTNPFTYNGKQKGIGITNYPTSLVTPVYTDNIKTNAGTYTASVSFTYDMDNYTLSNGLDDQEWKINKADATINTSNVETSYVYTTQKITISGATLNHNEVTLEYVHDDIIDVGTYNVTIKAASSENYNYKEVSIVVEVTKATIDMTGVKWNYKTPFTYDGNEKQIEVIDYLPLVTPNYQNNKFTNVGTYTASVSFTYDTKNYKLSNQVANQAWAISKAQAVISVDQTTITKTYGEAVTLPTATTTFGTVSCNKKLADLVNAGTYTVTYTVTGTANYDGDTKSLTVIINKAKVVEPEVSGTYTYTGSEQTVTLTGVEAYMSTTDSLKATNAGDHTVTFALDDNHEWDTDNDGVVTWTIAKAKATITVDQTTITSIYGQTVTLPKATTNFGTVSCDKTSSDLVNVGTYTVTYTVEGTSNFDGDSKSLEVVIINLKVNEPKVSGTYTYNKSEQTVTLTGVESYMSTTSSLKGTNAGTYTITYTLDDNHEWAEGSDGVITWTIQKLAIDEPVATGTYVYTGEVQNPIITGVDKDAMLTSTTINGTDAGEYTITYTLDDNNYVWAEGSDGVITWTIDKAQAVISVDQTTITKTYGETVTLPTATTTFGTVTCNKTSADLVNANTYTVTYTVEGTSNFDGDTKTLTVVINKLKVNEPQVSGTYTYNRNEQTVVLTGVESYMSTNASLKRTNAGNYTITYTLDGNHEWNEGSDGIVNWSINKAKASITVDQSTITKTYGETVTLPKATTTFGAVACNKSSADLVNVGTYMVTYTVTGTSNYDGDSKSLTVVINKAKVDEPEVSGEYTYTGKAQTVELTGVESYMSTTDSLNGTNVGTYTITYTLDGNHEWNEGSDGTITWSITKAQAVISVDQTTITKKYGETIALPTATTNLGEVSCDKTLADLVNVGTYIVTYTVEGTSNYDGDTKSLTVTINKGKAVISVDQAQINKEYGETVKLPTATSNFGEVLCDKTSTDFVNIGTYTATYSIEGTSNYDGDTKTVIIVIGKAKVNKPKVSGNYTYTGDEQTVTLTGVESYMSTTDSLKATNAGEYTITYTLDDNHEWAPGTDGIVTWIINKAKVSAPIEVVSKVYTGNELTSELADGTLYTVTQATGTNVGEYDVTVTLDDNDNYKWSTGEDTPTRTLKFAITKAKATITVDQTTITKTYGQIVTLPEATTTFGKVTCNKTPVDLVDADTYTVTYAVEGTANYDGDSKSLTVVINKAKVNEPKVSGEYTYDGEEQIVTLTGVESYMSTTSLLKQTNAGEHKITYTLDGNHEWAEGSDGVITWTIGKAQAVITVDTTTITKTYGESVTLPEATTNFGEVSCDMNSADLVNVGTYTVTYTVEGTTNYDGDSKSLTIVINKAQAVITVDQTTITKTYGETITLPEATTTFGKVTCDKTSADLVNVDTYTVTYTVEGTTNYDGDVKTLTVVINKAKATITVDQNTITKTYGQTITLPEATTTFGKVTCNKKSTDLVNVGTYTVTYTVEATSNYDGDTKSLTVVINKAVYDMTNVSFENASFVYDGTNKELALTGTLPEGVTYELENNGLTNVGQKKVVAKFTGDTTNYEQIASIEAILTITKANAIINVNQAKITKTYGESITLPIATSNFGDVICDVKESSIKNVGTYKITYTVLPTDNYIGDVKEVEVEIIKLVIDLSMVKWNEVVSFEYDGMEKTVSLQELPDLISKYVTIEFKDNKKTEIGDYIASVTISYDTTNIEIKNNISNLNWKIVEKVVEKQEKKGCGGCKSSVASIFALIPLLLVLKKKKHSI